MSEEVVTDTAPATADTAPGTTTTAEPATPQVTPDMVKHHDEPAPDTQQTTSDNDKPASNDAEWSLPDEYKEKPWAAKIKSQDDLYKQLDNMNSLVGKKTIQPIDYEKATPEEIADYHSKLAPEDVKDYGFKEETSFSKGMADVFKKQGLTSYQGQEILKSMGPLVEGAKAEATSLDGYNSLMKESFGDDFEKVAGFVEANLKKHASDEDKKLFDGVDNTTRVAIDRTINNILKAYGVTETGAQANGDTGNVQTTDINEIRSGLRQQIRDLDKTIHTQADKDKLVQKLNDTYQK